MKDTRPAFLTFLVVLVAMPAAPANATPVIGQPVQGVGDPTPTGNQGDDGTIEFHILRWRILPSSDLYLGFPSEYSARYLSQYGVFA